ncbi:MAG TPA: sensor histidine kinase [Bryobacteraceae bacterium]|nr:sensor histidine kinase [Bryobacteraceae bacterium]
MEKLATETRPNAPMAAVVIGFAGLLLLMSFLAWDSSRQIREVKEQSARLRAEFRRRDSLLDQLRQILSEAGAGQRERAAARTLAAGLLSTYRALLPAEEKADVDALRREADQYLDQPPAPLSFAALDAHLNALDLRDKDTGEDRLEALQSSFQKRVLALSILAIAAGAGLALAVGARQWKLQRQAAARFLEAEAARRDLRQLSAKLVQTQEEERRRLSRELHDEVGQSMTAMLMDLGRLESRIDPAAGCAPILASIRKTAEEAVGRVRDLSLVLRPSLLDELGLVPALHWQAREVERRHGLHVRTIAEEEAGDNLPEAQRTCIYRIVQEALHNAVKYAEATEARVTMRRAGGTLEVEVRDNGRGFLPSKQKGLGILGMEERAAAVGGTLSLRSRPGETAVTVRLPLREGL